MNFAVSGRERTGFWRETRRNALRAPAAVRRTTVMLNSAPGLIQAEIWRFLYGLRLLFCGLFLL